MGKWTDRLKTLNASATPPAEPAEGTPSGGNAGEVTEGSRLPETESRLLQGMSEEQAHAVLQVRDLFDGVIEEENPNESQIDAADLLGRRAK